MPRVTSMTWRDSSHDSKMTWRDVTRVNFENSWRDVTREFLLVTWRDVTWVSLKMTWRDVTSLWDDVTLQRMGESWSFCGILSHSWVPQCNQSFFHPGNRYIYLIVYYSHRERWMWDLWNEVYMFFVCLPFFFSKGEKNIETWISPSMFIKCMWFYHSKSILRHYS